MCCDDVAFTVVDCDDRPVAWVRRLASSGANRPALARLGDGAVAVDGNDDDDDVTLTLAGDDSRRSAPLDRARKIGTGELDDDADTGTPADEARESTRVSAVLPVVFPG